MKRSLIISLFSIVALLPATQAQADPCQQSAPQPFQDVVQTDIFCTDTTWAKNANITFGCGNGTNFCPSDIVTRAQMVLFLRRMAEATFPAAFMTESSAAPSGDLDSTFSACATPMIPPTVVNGYFAHVVAVVSLQGGAGDAEVQISVDHDVSGAPTFSDHFVNPIVMVPTGQWATASVSGFLMPLLGSPGAPAQWRINLSRAPGSATTGELAGLRCQLKIFRTMSPV